MKVDKFFDKGDVALILIASAISIACFVVGIVDQIAFTPWYWLIMSVLCILSSIDRINNYNSKYKK